MPDRKQDNAFLKLMAQADYEAWQPHLLPMEMPAGKVIYEQGFRSEHVYFPLNGIVSLIYMLENGASTEIAMIGQEGMVGVHQLMGTQVENHSAIVQSKGTALRLPIRWIQHTFQTSNVFRNLVLHFVHTLMTQMGQASVCNRHHTVEQQLCRLLLLSLDRVGGDELHLTQEVMARLLGVRREGVTLAAMRLVKLDLIHYTRGHIKVLNRHALESRACECYQVIQGEYRWLNGTAHTTFDFDHAGTNIFRMA